MMKRIFVIFVAAVLLLVAVLLVNTVAYKPSSTAATPIQPRLVDEQKVARHLSQAIQYRTVSSELAKTPTHPQFESFIDWLAATYPRAHQSLSPQYIAAEGGSAQYSVLFTWSGSRQGLAPILLSAHYDVVPVIPGTDNLWRYPPYSGTVDETHIWGRGALDDKSAVIALMEAATLLLAEGFQPERTVYLSLTHNEEVGSQGAAAIASKLKRQGVQLAWSLDEGSFLLRGFIPGVEIPVASINVAEKGYLTVDLVAHGQGGHSSIPPRQTAVDVLAAALVKLQASPVPGGLEGVSGDFFDAIVPHMPFGQRLLFANPWLFGGLIDSALAENPVTRAMLHTTSAPTMLSASVKENVLPIEAVATVNLRIHPRDTIAGLVEYMKLVIDDSRVDVIVRRGQPASRVSDAKAAGFKAIADAAQRTYGLLIVAPGLTVAATDSRQYVSVADNAYRFNPMVLTQEDATGFHGTNERISIDNMVKATNFYTVLIQHGSGPAE